MNSNSYPVTLIIEGVLLRARRLKSEFKHSAIRAEIFAKDNECKERNS